MYICRCFDNTKHLTWATCSIGAVIKCERVFDVPLVFVNIQFSKNDMPPRRRHTTYVYSNPQCLVLQTDALLPPLKYA